MPEAPRTLMGAGWLADLVDKVDASMSRGAVNVSFPFDRNAGLDAVAWSAVVSLGWWCAVVLRAFWGLRLGASSSAG